MCNTSNSNDDLCKTIHVLLADDEPEFLEMVELFLLGHHYQVTKVSDGLQAWNLLNDRTTREKFDAVISDYSMPGFNGAELCSRLRNRGFDKPILIFTGEWRPLTQSNCEEAGCTGYFNKSNGVEPLLDKLNELFREETNCEDSRGTSNSP